MALFWLGSLSSLAAKSCWHTSHPCLERPSLSRPKHTLTLFNRGSSLLCRQQLCIVCYSWRYPLKQVETDGKHVSRESELSQRPVKGVGAYGNIRLKKTLLLKFFTHIISSMSLHLKTFCAACSSTGSFGLELPGRHIPFHPSLSDLFTTSDRQVKPGCTSVQTVHPFSFWFISFVNKSVAAEETPPPPR